MGTEEELRKEIESIKGRNARVETDKAWEISLTRRSAIAIGTYLLSAVFLLVINAQNPFLAAIVPTAGFLISTLALGPLKAWWLSRRS